VIEYEKTECSWRKKKHSKIESFAMKQDYQIAMDNSLRENLRKHGLQKLVCLLSRRAAGVWSLLPSLAYHNLHDMQGGATIVLIDFGKRFEMFEHFNIDPASFSDDCSISYLAQHSDKKKLLDYYTDFILNKSISTDISSEYIAFTKKIGGEGKHLLLCPFKSSHSPNDNPDIPDYELLKIGLLRLAEIYKPDVVYLTFEGQPERPLFDEKLAEDRTMQLSLDISDIILSLVRTDSPTKFEEGIAIPAYLAENPEWGKKIFLFLTRHSHEIALPDDMSNFAIGTSPYFDQMGQSIETGRIPWIDFITNRYKEFDAAKMNSYLSGIGQASSTIISDIK